MTEENQQDMAPRDFKQARQARARWKRLAAAFFKPAPAPTPVQTEAFVARVMSRVRAEARLPWWAARWVVPALGVGLAVSLFVVSLTGNGDSALPLDAQLLAGSDSSVAQLAAPAASPSAPLLLPEAP